MNTLVVFEVEEWVVLYVNSEEVAAGHSLTLRDLAPYTPIVELKIIPAHNSALDRYACETGSWPKTFFEALALSQIP